MHGLLFFLVFILFVFVAALAWLPIAKKLNAQEDQGTAPRYEAVTAFLSAAERSFFGVLHQALASEYQIFVKVRLADMVRPVRNPSRSGWQASFNRITGKHVDFVLCDLAKLNVVGVVELDDRSHERFERGVRDGLVDTALADAGIPVLKIAAKASYSLVEIRQVKGE